MSLSINMPRRHLGSCLATQETRLLFSFEEHSHMKILYSAIFRTVRTTGGFFCLLEIAIALKIAIIPTTVLIRLLYLE